MPSTSTARVDARHPVMGTGDGPDQLLALLGRVGVQRDHLAAWVALEHGDLHLVADLQPLADEPVLGEALLPSSRSR